MTDRVAVLPPLNSDIGYDAPMIVSKIFDLPRLSREIGNQVIDWADVKDSKSREMEVLGCWSVYMVQDMFEKKPRYTRNLWSVQIGAYEYSF